MSITGIGETVLDIVLQNGDAKAAVPGGSTFNAMISLGRTLGAERTDVELRMITQTGDDAVADIFASFMKANGVSPDHVVRSRGQSTLSLAMLDESSNARYEFFRDRNLPAFEAPELCFGHGDIVLFGSFFAINPETREQTRSIIRKAHEAGAIVYYDINFRKNHNSAESLPQIEENIALSDIVRGSSEDIEALYGSADAALVYREHIAALCPNFICTRGAQQTEVFSPGLHRTYPVPQDTEVVSTIGAGDNFNAGVVYSLAIGLKDWDDIVPIAHRFSANVVASIWNYVDTGFKAVIPDNNKKSNDMNKLEQIASRFAIEGKIAGIKPLGEGFINDTLTVTLEGEQEPSYILQRKNHVVFPDVPAMMDNIERVTRFIKSRVHDPLRQTLTVIPTKDGALYYKDEDGNFWAMTLFIRDTMSYTKADSPEMAYQGGLGLGQFHRLVDGFKEPLAEVIKGFHNIRWRFQQWDEAIARDAAGRVKDLSEEISWIESRREKMLSFWNLFETGVIPTRVTHNDTKISNFLFNADDGSLLCAIDLDTLMSSTLLNDTGDALRSYTNPAEEDEPDLSKVFMDIRMFQAYMEGYLSMMKDKLTESELKYLAFSGLYITYEQVLRFLMDYIDGDTYYRIKYPDHNLVRTRAQYKLLTSMEEQLPAMEAVIQKILPAV